MVDPSPPKSRSWLVALLAMLAIALIFASMPIKWSGSADQARVKAAHLDMTGYRVGLRAFQADVGRYPSTTEGLGALNNWRPDVLNWRGPYVKRFWPNDPWGHPYAYERTTSHEVIGFRLASGGPDGRIGTSDDLVFTGP